MNIIKHKNIYFLISILIIIPGIISLFLYGLKLSIDFTGGSRMTIQSSEFKKAEKEQEVKKIITDQKVELNSVQKSGETTFIIRTKPLEQKQHQDILNSLQKKYTGVRETDFETIGPTIGSETTTNAIKATVIASFLILLYIAWSFRKVPKPASSFRFGVCAIVAVLHDVLVVIGLFSIFGKVFNVEIDSLFVTALLTIIGFSVHDTIVVFDRIRENLRRNPTAPFASTVNDSILQTLGRSLNTSITVILVLFTMLLFGGETIRWFIVALLLGIISGTFSSIFNAAPLLVTWEEWNRKRVKK